MTPLPLVCPFKKESVCTFKTFPCVPAPRAHVLKHMRAWCQHTRRRFECTHGDVLNGLTGVFNDHTGHNTTRRQRQRERQRKKKEKEDRKRERLFFILFFLIFSIFSFFRKFDFFVLSIVIIIFTGSVIWLKIQISSHPELIFEYRYRYIFGLRQKFFSYRYRF